MIARLVIAHALLGSCVHALGINCHGNKACGNSKYAHDSDAETLRNVIQLIPTLRSRVFNDGEIITCTDYSICAFVEHTGGRGLDGITVSELADAIVDHNCLICGTAPADGKDINNGALTFNYYQGGCNETFQTCFDG